MAETLYMRFLNRLIAKTKSGEITWQYLDSNKALCQKMGWKSNEEPDPIGRIFAGEEIAEFNADNSFYTEVSDTNIVIYEQKNDPASLYVIPPTFRKILCLNAEEYGEYITRLLNVVQRNFPNPDQFIVDFLRGDY